MEIVPSWGGSMFEALMVPLLVPEARWGPRSWGVNHPLYVRVQVEHGLKEAGYGYWGFSPSNNPSGGYCEYGVDAIGLNPDGYASNNDNTLVDYGFGDCRPAQPLPPPEAYTNGVVTPHASFLALPYARRAALDNLDRLRRDFDLYGEGGFFDAVNVDSGQVSAAGRPWTRAWSWPPSATSSPATASSATSPGARSSGRSAPCWPWRSSPPAADRQGPKPPSRNRFSRCSAWSVATSTSQDGVMTRPTG
jgi:hypothetical protein